MGWETIYIPLPLALIRAICLSGCTVCVLLMSRHGSCITAQVTWKGAPHTGWYLHHPATNLSPNYTANSPTIHTGINWQNFKGLMARSCEKTRFQNKSKWNKFMNQGQGTGVMDGTWTLSLCTHPSPTTPFFHFEEINVGEINNLDTGNARHRLQPACSSSSSSRLVIWGVRGLR